jgi:general secretion pathway protein B
VPISPVPGAGTTIVTKPRNVIQPAPATTPQVRPSVVTQAAAPISAQEPVPATASVHVTQTVPARPRQPGVQLWSDLPLEFRSTFTLPHIDVHVYAEQPARRFILVDLQKYREGDTLENGGVIEKILPHGLQLYYQGTRFEIEK